MTIICSACPFLQRYVHGISRKSVVWYRCGKAIADFEQLYPTVLIKLLPWCFPLALRPSALFYFEMLVNIIMDARKWGKELDNFV